MDANAIFDATTDAREELLSAIGQAAYYAFASDTDGSDQVNDYMRERVFDDVNAALVKAFELGRASAAADFAQLLTLPARVAELERAADHERAVRYGND